MTEAEMARAVNGGNEVALEAEIIHGLREEQPLSVVAEQLGEGGAADVAEAMIQPGHGAASPPGAN